MKQAWRFSSASSYYHCMTLSFPFHRVAVVDVVVAHLTGLLGVVVVGRAVGPLLPLPLPRLDVYHHM